MARMVPWPNVRYKPPIVQREFKGVNKAIDSFSLSDIFATDEKNLTSSSYPAASVRPGQIYLGDSLPPKVLGMGVFKESELHVIWNDGTWNRWTGTEWQLLGSGLDTSAEYTFANFKGNLTGINIIATNGVDFKRYDGLAVFDLDGVPSGGNLVEQYGDRLWCVISNTLHFSAYRMADDWTTVNQDDADSGFIEIETPNGELVSCLIGSSSKLTLAKPSSIHELYGTSASDFRLVPVCKGIGISSRRHAVVVNGLLYFIDVNNPSIHEYGGGSLPSNSFSQPVQWYLNRMNASGKMNACTGTDGKLLYVSIPVQGTTPDTVLVYDFMRKSWDVWGDMSPEMFTRLGSTLYFGNGIGKVIEIGGTDDFGSPIAWRRVSIPYTAMSMAQKVRLMRMWLVANLSAGSTLNVYISKLDSGDSDWELVQSVTATGKLESTRIIIPTGTAANANWIRIKLEGTGRCELKEFARDMQEMPVR